jgi:hypothetical protein
MLYQASVYNGQAIVIIYYGLISYDTGGLLVVICWTYFMMLSVAKTM